MASSCRCSCSKLAGACPAAACRRNCSIPCHCAPPGAPAARSRRSAPSDTGKLAPSFALPCGPSAEPFLAAFGAAFTLGSWEPSALPSSVPGAGVGALVVASRVRPATLLLDGLLAILAPQVAVVHGGLEALLAPGDARQEETLRLYNVRHQNFALVGAFLDTAGKRGFAGRGRRLPLLRGLV
eukprot:scaffold744_cov370-Prasinococcus_capsulatus_cf.AAC.15